MHISFYISDSLLGEVDNLARLAGISRSKFLSNLIDKNIRGNNTDQPSTTHEKRDKMESEEVAAIRTDCRFYRGEIPCEKKKVCWKCEEFAPIGKRALVIKFGAAGDALRTTPILRRLRKDGFDEITWICDEQSHEVLSLAENIDRLIVAGPETIALLAAEEFDSVFSFDKAPFATALAMMARSTDKRGFSATPQGRLGFFNSKAGYALRLGVDDELKFRINRKTVPELTFEIAGKPFAGEEYELRIPPASERLPNRVALNLGVGPKWPTKSWPAEHWEKLARLLLKNGWEPVLVGGPAETELLKSVSARSGAPSRNPAALADFAGFLASCAAVVTCDSLALHVAIAVGTEVFGLFCSTSAREIEWYGRGVAIVAPDGPCYNSRCDHWPSCMLSIAPGSVFVDIERRLRAGHVR